MPFREELDNVYYSIQEIGKELKCEVIRVDHFSTTDKITDRIIKHIIESNLLIADITYNNANVFFEVGYAFAIGKELLLIAKNVNDIPFDIKDYKVTQYLDVTNFRKIKNTLKLPIVQSLNRSMKRANLTKPLIEIIHSISKNEPSENLFDKLLETRFNDTLNNLLMWNNGKMNVDPNDTISKGIQVFHNLKIGGFATNLVSIGGYWTFNKSYIDEGRKVAKQGKNIKRVYILPSYTALFSLELRNLISEDENCNIETYVAFSDEIPKEAVRDFGIWDDEVLCLIDTIENPHGGTEVRGCLFSKDPIELNNARYWKDLILNVSYKGKKILEELDNLGENDYLLPISAEIMEKNAEKLCRGSYFNREECSWYHSSWQYLRLLNLVSTPFWHNDFYITGIYNEIKERTVNNILISGIADYGMLQHVHKASKNNSKLPNVTILDICRTPIEICRWYSDKYMGDYKINFIQKDAKKTDFKNSTFDIIITDAFLTRFKDNDQREIINEWTRIVNDNGVVITTIRFNKNGKNKAYRSNPAEVNYFIHKAEMRIEKNDFLKPIRDKILHKAKLYAENIVSYPFRDEDSIKNLFFNYNVKIDVAKTSGELIEQTNYARVIARKKMM